MKVNRVVVGELNTNCYILSYFNNCLIVDPGDEYELIDNFISKNNFNLLGILITHYHSDHIGALDKLLLKYSPRVYDNSNLGINNINEFNFEVISNPGHTSDSVSFYFKEGNLMFVGDFIFKENIGRCDLPTGNYSEMLNSLKEIKKYSDITILYPGHGTDTTIKHELLNNSYLGEV